MIDGRWQLQLDLPMGAREAVLDVDSDGEALRGVLRDDSGPKDLTGGELRGDSFAFVVTYQAMATPLLLQFAGRIDGDRMAGSVDVGEEQTGTFQGERVPGSGG